MPLMEVNRTKSDLDDDGEGGDTLLDTAETSTADTLKPPATQTEVMFFIHYWTHYYFCVKCNR